MYDHDVHCGRLRSLQPVLKRWIQLNRVYAKRMQWEDCGWWSNERATTSILAAAAWKCGGIALEEFSTRKVKRKKEKPGRCDLFFEIGREKFACEIKQIFPRLRNDRVGDISNVRERFDSACKDARDLSRQEGRRLGICFVTPRFSRSQIQYMDNCLDDYLERLHQNQRKLGFHAIAWFFPKEACDMTWPGNDKTYPGIIVLIREVDRS